MTFLDAIQNHGSCDSAVAVQTLASGLALFGFLTFKGKTLGHAPAKSGAGNPALFAVGGSNPDFGVTLRVIDRQTPLGVNGLDIFVGNNVLFYGVDNNDMGVRQGQLWSHPKTKNSKSGYSSENYVEQRIAHSLVIENGLTEVEGIEQQCYRTPDQIALGFENDFIIHNNILAGKTIAKKENA
jgi:hypothetical protein